jgi:hypothetical protein
MLFYKHYRTPRLTIDREDGHANLLIANGKPLLKDPLPEDASEDDLKAAAIKEITFLVIRDLVDIVPKLRQFNTEKPFIQLPIHDMNVIRKAAFLRGHIPYITKKIGAEIGKRIWLREIKRPTYPVEYFQGNLERMQVISCDWACSVLPEVVHNDVYANGRLGGGRGFAREWLFDFAQENDILISSIPIHPLEKASPELEVVEKPILKNDLKPAPDGELDLNPGKKFPLDAKGLLKTREANGSTLSDHTFQNIVMRIKMDAREPIYCIDSQPANRYQMMQYIPWAISEGKTLREICKGINGTPTMLEIARWLQWYPDFRREMETAEAIQAHTFVDWAQEIIMESSADRDKLNLAKAQANFMLKRAALQSEKFREKKVIQTENLDNKNEAEVKRKLKMLLRGDVVADIIDVEPEPKDELESENAI